MLCVALLVCLLQGVLGAVPGDLITSLPGYNGTLKSKHYSGYLPVGNKEKFLHYWFIESENNPATDPVTLWLNGGPGSSSLIGLFTENGQLATNDDSLTYPINGIPQVFYNNFSWQKVSSTIYLESPAGVGFSYCLSSGTNNTVVCSNTDDSTASDAYDFLVNFFQSYPEYSKNDFYITGESYAGIYIPMLAEQIMNRSTTINLKGLAIGDGCWGNTVGTCDFGSGDALRISTNFYHGHAMVSETLFQQIITACGDFSKMSAQCSALITQMDAELGQYDVYNIYDECGSDDLSFSDIFGKNNKTGTYYLKAFSKDMDEVNAWLNSHKRPSSLLGAATNDYTCGGETAMSSYLKEPSVRTAIHVRSDNPGQRYTKTATNLLPLYKTLVQKYRVLIYSGDADACVPYYGTEEWTQGLGFPVTEDWRPWTSQFTTGYSGTAGYVTKFTNDFTFLTIKGAGHMVPTYKPVPALTFISRWLAGQPF
jgi:carboxypeptidase C (cathepsin A)